MLMLDTVLVSLGIALGLYEPAVAIGATQRRLNGNRAMLFSLTYACMLSAIALCGIGLDQLMRMWMPGPAGEKICARIAAFLLIFLGAGMLWRGRHKKWPEERLKRDVAVLDGVNGALRHGGLALAAGMAAGLTSEAVLLEILPLFALSMAFILMGLLMGYRQGYRWPRAFLYIGGTLICLLAARYMVFMD